MGEETYHRIEYSISAEVVAWMGDKTLAEHWYDELSPMPARWGGGISGSLDRSRGLLALRLDLADDAEMYFERALEWCESEKCPVEAGRCHQGLADVAERRGDLESAREHLDAAGELFAKHGAKLYLDQVLAKKEILKA
jgi:hypothetical protein